MIFSKSICRSITEKFSVMAAGTGGIFIVRYPMVLSFRGFFVSRRSGLSEMIGPSCISGSYIRLTVSLYLVRKSAVEERLNGKMVIAFKGNSASVSARGSPSVHQKLFLKRKAQYSPRKKTSAPYRWKELVFGKRLPSEMKQQDWREAKAAS